MKPIASLLSRLYHEDDGAVAIEYGLLATLIAVAIIAGASALGGGLNTMFENLSKCFAADKTGCPGL